ncbi:MAG: UbiA family prenyltransferase, partial [Candidatus Eremiobacteraeota bacterium]|nr:UbiA family prenyltransferase [Candidatus Eremiobacteraeota bacterium]
GMFLNDAFDHPLDARERPERPIPAGIVTARDVFISGGALMACGWIAIVAAAGLASLGSMVSAAVAGAALIGSIVLYDAWHKGNAFGPAIMGICRVLVYVTAAVAIAPHVPARLAAAALMLFAYLIGLTYVANQENRSSVTGVWPLVLLGLPVVYGIGAIAAFPLTAIAVAVFVIWLVFALSFLVVPRRFDARRGVVALIAGISLLDAIVIAGAGQYKLAILAVGAWGLTRYLQRYIAGT